MYNRYFHIQILQGMTEVYKDIPSWFWLLLFLFGSAVILGLVGILVWLIQRYLTNNEKSWAEVRTSLSELIGISKMHEYRIEETKQDLVEFKMEVRGRGHIVKYP